MPKGLLAGLALGGVTLFVGWLLPAPLRAPLVGVLLGLAAGVYPGFALGGRAAPDPLSSGYPMLCLSYDAALAAFAAWLAVSGGAV